MERSGGVHGAPFTRHDATAAFTGASASKKKQRSCLPCSLRSPLSTVLHSSIVNASAPHSKPFRDLRGKKRRTPNHCSAGYTRNPGASGSRDVEKICPEWDVRSCTDMRAAWNYTIRTAAVFALRQRAGKNRTTYVLICFGL